jgi:ribosome-associated toxin RatA of RatAB toxin-antitoxin module
MLARTRPHHRPDHRPGRQRRASSKRLTWLALLGPLLGFTAAAEVAPRVPLTATNVPGRAMPRLEATLTIEAPVDKVAALVADCDRFGEFMDVEKSKVIERRGNIKRCKLVVDVPFPFGSLESVNEETEERTPGVVRESWKLVSGDFYYDEGFWELKPTPQGYTQVRYVALVEPKLPVPRSMLLGGQKDYIRDMLLKLRKRLLTRP